MDHSHCEVCEKEFENGEKAYIVFTGNSIAGVCETCESGKPEDADTLGVYYTSIKDDGIVLLTREAVAETWHDCSALG